MSSKYNVEMLNAISQHFTTKQKQSRLNFGIVRKPSSFLLIFRHIDYARVVRRLLNMDKAANIWNVHLAKQPFASSALMSYKRIGNAEDLINSVGRLREGNLCYENSHLIMFYLYSYFKYCYR